MSTETEQNIIDDSDTNNETETKSMELDEIYDNIEENINEEKQIRTGADRKSFPRMTRYEFVRLIGERKQQLSLGAKSFIKNKDDFTIDELVLEEFKNKLIPFKIRRKLPNNIIEEWDINELDISHLEID
jgi:DNA-directed RNA polymerase I, II, and III subunit RPABC2